MLQLFTSRTLSTDSTISVQQKNEENIEKFPCSYCKKIFLSKSAQQAHIKFVHKKMNLLFCPYQNCNRSYNNKYRLETHINKHKGLKLFKCEICHRSFTEQGTLNTHYVIHKDEKPYKCSICYYQSKTNSQMRHHYKFIHNDDKYYKCNYCDKKYSRKAELRHHINLHKNIIYQKNIHFFKPKIIIDDRNNEKYEINHNIINTNDNHKIKNIFKYDDNIKEINEILFGVFCY